MSEVWIVVDEADLASPTATQGLNQMVSALKHAITDSASTTISPVITEPQSPIAVQVVTTKQLISPEFSSGARSNAVLCPLTLNLPPSWAFAEAALYRACQDVAGLRQRVAQTPPFKTGSGHFWLPVVLTAKGPLYAEVIARSPSRSTLEPSTDLFTQSYTQPLHLSDALRQPLYQLAHWLLKSLAAPPAVYLMQFGIQESDRPTGLATGQSICFDRLFPFPAVPSIASLGVQVPDLFTCHWRCITMQPILELMIRSSVTTD